MLEPNFVAALDFQLISGRVQRPVRLKDGAGVHAIHPSVVTRTGDNINPICAWLTGADFVDRLFTSIPRHGAEDREGIAMSSLR